MVIGHWFMADVRWDAGELVVANSLSSLPALEPLTWALQVVPLFFAAGAVANAAVWRRVRARGDGWPGYLAERMARLLGPVVLFAVLAQLGLGLLWWSGSDASEVRLVARALGQPLWFLLVYAVITAAAPLMLRWHERSPWSALVLPALGSIAMDALRMRGVEGAGAPATAVASYLLVWTFAHQLGLWYAAGRLMARSPRVRGSWFPAMAALAAGGVLLGLTVFGPYPVSMIGLPGQMSNMAPPTVCLVLLAVVQVMVLSLAAPALRPRLERPAMTRAVAVLGARGIQLYLWHMAALVVVLLAARGAGLRPPAVATTQWWLTRPVLFAASAAVLLGLVVGAGRLMAGVRAGTRCVTRRDARWLVDRRRMRVTLVLVGWPLAIAGLYGLVTEGLEPVGGHMPASMCLLAGWAVLGRARI